MFSGSRLKELRDLRNVSQKELGEYVGVSDTMVSMYEQGKKKPSLPTIERIAEYFYESVDYLLGRENKDDLQSKTAHSIGLLARKADGLSKEDRDILMKHFEDSIDMYLNAKKIDIDK